MDPGLPLLICHLKARRQLRRPPPPRSSLHHWRQTPLWVPAPPPGLPPELPPQCTRSAISRRGASRAVHTRSHRVGVVIVLASGAGSARSSAINARLPGSAEGTRSAWRFAISRKGASKAGAGQRHARRAACAVLAGKHRADLGLAGRAALDLRAVLLAVGVAVVPVHVGRSRRCKRWCSTCIRGCGCCADIVAGII